MAQFRLISGNMEVKLVILSLACFSCLVPPAYGTSLLAAKAAAVGAGVAAVAAKGALIKGAAVLGAKALVKGAGLLAAKGLAAKGAVAAGAAALKAKVGGVLPEPAVRVAIPERTVVLQPPKLSNIFGSLTDLISTSHAAAKSKASAVGNLMASLLPSKAVVERQRMVLLPADVMVPPPFVVPPPPPMFDLPPPPPMVVMPPPPMVVMPPPVRVLPPPPMRVLPPAPAGVAIVGPTMNVYQDPHNNAYYPMPVVAKEDC